MTSIAWLLSHAIWLAAGSGDAPVAFEFKDAAAHEGRSMIHYRAVELRSTPVRPLGGDFKPSADAQHGLVPVGRDPDAALLIVWLPKTAGAPVLWLDSNGDGRLAADERHVLSGDSIEIPASIAVQWEPTPKRVQRTLLFRRSVLGDGLRYAVRGYAVGTLDLGGTKHATLLADGNADGLLDTVGQDRLWIDLNQDGRLDPLTEQFPLGKAISRAGQIYVVSSDGLGSAVRVRCRSGAEGKLRIDLALKPSAPPAKVSVKLVSDLGELAVIDKLGQAASVPVGEYYVSSLKLEVPDAAGEPWTYLFHCYDKRLFSVSAGRETAAALLASLSMEATVSRELGSLRPGEAFSVRPRLVADSALYLRACDAGSGARSLSTRRSAEILVLSQDGKTLERAVTGFT